MNVQRETDPLVQRYVDELREALRAEFWREFLIAAAEASRQRAAVAASVAARRQRKAAGDV